MPRSKRAKVVSLTKTTGKGSDAKTATIEMLRSACDEYKHVFGIRFENMRTPAFKEVRAHFKESRLFLGKNKLAQVALGKDEESEYRENIHMVSKKLVGDAGLFFTNRPKKEILDYFKNFNFVDYAKAGFVPTEDIVYETGPLPAKFPTSMIEQFRKLGMVVEVDNGTLVLRDDFRAATKGKPLTPEQCKAHVYFETKLSPFILTLDCFWSDGKFTNL